MLPVSAFCLVGINSSRTLELFSNNTSGRSATSSGFPAKGIDVCFIAVDTIIIVFNTVGKRLRFISNAHDQRHVFGFPYSIITAIIFNLLYPSFADKCFIKYLQ